MKQKSIFKLTLIALHRKRRKCKDDYPRFELNDGWCAYYSTLQQAEEAIPGLIKDFNEQGWDELHSCRIVELPLEEIMTSPNDNLSERVYDRNGMKLDERLFPTFAFMPCDESTYLGRKPEQIRFKPGDVAQYGDQLCVVDSFMRPFKEGEGPHGDSTDDGYNVWVVNDLADNIEIDEDGYPVLWHAHPQAVGLFPPNFPIPEKIQQRIDNIRKHFGYDKN